MTEKTTITLIESLRAGLDAAFPHFRHHLDETYPSKAIIETNEPAFNVFYFAQHGNCELKRTVGVLQEWSMSWDEHHRQRSEGPLHAFLDCTWDEKQFQLVITGVQAGHCRDVRAYILGDTLADVHAFFDAVCDFCSGLRHEILVFDDGFWSKDDELYESIKSSTLENLILEGSLKEDIVADVERFFASEEMFDKYQVAWKRGLLFLGPPGNGKTHMLKALANRFGVPCLYVRNFIAEYTTDHTNIKAVFEKARNMAPCILVFEDLDAHVTEKNRSYLLNELDGFYENRGILAIATTNHPERLDPAIIDRPSRFDRKYHFELPDADLRLQYLQMWNGGLQDELRTDTEDLVTTVDETEGFSFAYLKELCLSSMTTWIADAGARPMGECLSLQAKWLRGQMSTHADDVAEDEDDDPTTQHKRRAERMIRRRRRLTSGVETGEMVP